MFPATYVPQESERINLYRELDGMETDEQIAAFESRLTDRFGPIPTIGQELIRIVQLRHTARTLGIEKIALIQRNMYIYFVGEENVAYYQSAAFGRILTFAQNNPQSCKIRQVNGRRSFLLYNVTTVSQALDILRGITTLPSV